MFCMKKSLFYSVLILVLFTLKSSAQVDKIQKRTIQVNSPSVGQYNSGFEKFALKINPFLIFTGDFPIYAEYAIADWFAVEGSVGFTTEQYIITTILTLDDDEPYQDIEQRVVPQISYSFTAKFIPSEDVYDDAGYLGIYFGGKSYDKDYTVPNPNGVGNITLRDSRKIRDFGLVYGYYYALDSDKLFLDTYIGATLRRVDHNELQEDYSNNNGPVTAYTVSNSQYRTIGFLLGMKIGYLLF